MSHSTHIVIIGAGYGGLMTAIRLSRRLRHHDGAAITLVNAADRFVERIRLHQVATGQRAKALPIADLIDPARVNFVRARVTALHPTAKRISLTDDSGTRDLAYDVLVYAPGSAPVINPFPNAHHAYTLQPDSVARLHAALPAIAARSGTVVVIGGGLTGIETAAELAERLPGLRVELVTRGAFGAELSDAGRRALRAHFDRAGITVRDQVSVTGLEADRVHLANGTALSADAIVVAGGFAPSPLAGESGLAVDGAGRLIVDAALRAPEFPEIFGVGDSTVVTLADGTVPRMACATAMPMGSHAADAIAALVQGGTPEPFRFGYAVRCISLGRRAGLVQRVDPADRPIESVISGRPGAWVKELICTGTVLALRLERSLGPLYIWPKPHPPHTGSSVTASAHGRSV